MRLLIALAVAALIPSGSFAQQGFSCSIGDRGACLGFGETVCSSGGMCVNQNSACFDRYQCDYEGFTCKSNVTDCVATYDRLLDEHNRLIRDFNGLVDEHDTLIEAHNDLVDDYNETLTVVHGLEDDLDGVESCLAFARTLRDAQFCAP